MSELDNALDAVAWIEATVRHDAEARTAIATACDPVGLVDQLTAMLVGYVQMTYRPGVIDYCNGLRHVIEANKAAFEEADE